MKQKTYRRFHRDLRVTRSRGVSPNSRVAIVTWFSRELGVDWVSLLDTTNPCPRDELVGTEVGLVFGLRQRKSISAPRQRLP